MNNKKFLLGTLVIVLVLGMTLVGCSKGSKSSSGDGTTASKTGGGTGDSGGA